MISYLVDFVWPMASDWPLMRVEEMYLIKAEAEAMSGNLAGGKKATSPQELQDEVWLQRRMELWGEGYSFNNIAAPQPSL